MWTVMFQSDESAGVYYLFCDEVTPTPIAGQLAYPFGPAYRAMGVDSVQLGPPGA
jgi:hypothetical protein